MFPDAENVEWEQENETDWEAEFEMEVYIDQSGSIIKIESKDDEDD